jgi:hypothetical protein
MGKLRTQSGSVGFKRRGFLYRFTSFLVLLTFSTTQITWAGGPVSVGSLDERLPETQVTNPPPASPNPEVPFVETSTQFLTDASPLSEVSSWDYEY